MRHLASIKALVLMKPLLLLFFLLTPGLAALRQVAFPPRRHTLTPLPTLSNTH